MTKGSQRRWLGLAASAVFLALLLLHLRQNEEWQSFSWDRLGESLLHARPGLLLAAVASTYVSYLLRACRWQFFLDPIKKHSSLWVLFAGQILGFSSIYLIGRPGELVRPAYIARKERVPFTSMLAVWLLERVYDSLAMVLLFSATLHLLRFAPATHHGRRLLAHWQQGGNAALLLTLVIITCLVIFRLRAEQLTAAAGRALAFLPASWRRGLRQLARSFAEGLNVIQNWRDLTASIVLTALLWVVNTSFLWFTFHSVGLGSMSWMASALVLFCAALGLLIQLPGVGGGYQVGVILALTRIFRVSGQQATEAAILVWILLVIPCLALGLIIVIQEGSSFRRLGGLAREAQEAALQRQ